MTSSPGPRIELIEHTADVGLRVRAATPREALGALAEAVFDIMVEREQVQPAEHRQVRIEADGWEDLVVAFLEELLYLYETEGQVLNTCAVREIDAVHLEAEIRGERLDPERHQSKVQIKAVTYHQLQAGPVAEGFEIRVIFDI